MLGFHHEGLDAQDEIVLGVDEVRLQPAAVFVEHLFLSAGKKFRAAKNAQCSCSIAGWMVMSFSAIGFGHCHRPL